MEDKKNKTFELVLGDDQLEDGVSTISFVEFPAIEEDFMFFSKETEAYKFESDGEKFMVTGPAMIPNKKIVRMTEDQEKYWVVFSEETIAKCNELFFKRSQHNSSNVDHMFAVDGVSVIESWLIQDSKNDKANAMGFEGLPKGTWMTTYKIDNMELWNAIKNGDVKGFSIEGKFIEELTKMASEKVEEPEVETPGVEEQITEEAPIEEENKDIYEEIHNILQNEDDSEKIYDAVEKLLIDNGIIDDADSETE